jgi:GGDEF domain-containing protein
MGESSTVDPHAAARFILDPAYDVPYRYPYAASIARQRASQGSVETAAAMLEKWQAIDLGDPGGIGSFPWLNNCRLFDPTTYAPDPKSWTPWRTDDRKLNLAHDEFERRFLSPIVNAEGAAALLEWSQDADPRLSSPAAELWRRLEPRIGWELASNVPAGNPWLDSLALWCLTRRPLLLDAEQPLALAIAKRLSDFARRRGGRLVGQRFPFHEKYLVSATAQLATALLVLGQDLDLAAQLAMAVSEGRDADGGWSDAGNPPDIMSTLVAADLMLVTDPEWDPGPSAAFFDTKRNSRGTWTAFGPEEPWITSEVLSWKLHAGMRFAGRFLWPHISPSTRDHKLSLPNYTWFEQAADLFASLPGLSRQPMTAAFIDLAGFGNFNNRFGQDTGDEVLRRFASHLSATLPGGRPCRDGGDEFLVIGTPTGTTLEADLETMRFSWPAAFHRAFGDDVPAVSPRIVTVACRCSALRDARRVLGQAIAGLKAKYPSPPETGVTLSLGWIGGPAASSP